MKKRTYSSTFYLRSLQLIALFLSVYFTVFYYQKINIYILIACFYWYTHVGISTAMHRYFSHRSFKASDWGSYFLAFWSVLSMVGSPIFWAVIHRQHHQKSDTQQDPHGYTSKGIFKILLGLWYNDVSISRNELNDLLKEKSLNWAHRHYFKIIFCWILFLFLIDKWAPVFYYFLPVIFGIFIVNLNLILHHKLGYTNFDNHDYSHNNWIMFPISWGECWHNNHHQNPSHESTKVKWWEFDPGIIFVRIFEKRQTTFNKPS